VTAGVTAGAVRRIVPDVSASVRGATGSLPAHDLAVASIGLTKRFRGGQVAVDGVDLAVPRGAVYGFLGP